MNKKIISAFMIVLLLTATSCGKKKGNVIYEGPYSEINGFYGGVDDLGREFLYESEAGNVREGKTVGIFYYLVLGAHGTDGPYDVTKILEKDNEAFKSAKSWIKAGGGEDYKNHWWAEPLFGYYKQDDVWVVRKHMQMLTDAGIDYLILDSTNGYPNVYPEQSQIVLDILDEFYKQGMNVPQVAFYTAAVSGVTMNYIYNEIYLKNPQYAHLWFQWDGKPLIIGDINDPETEDGVKDFFRIKANQWPNEPKKEDGWPWIEFDRILTKDAIYGLNKRKEVISVSPAQHLISPMSGSAFYGGDNRKRSWHDGKNDMFENSYLYGMNFAEQWEWAIKQNPETIFVTQWNEWTAYRLPSDNPDQPILMIDLADVENSRDIEPVKGLFGDNYYMQLCYYIAKFKGTAPRVNTGENITIDISGDFSQWDNVTAVYKDYVNEIGNRKARGFGTLKYEDESGRNDFDTLKVARDDNNIYFYVKTVSDITSSSDSNWMTLFINNGNKEDTSWHSFNYAVNRQNPDSDEVLVERFTGGWNFAETGRGKIKLEGNQMMISVPREAIGVSEEESGGFIDINFKWADNYDNADIWSFYTQGDAAPYGRLTFVFSNKA